MSKSRERVFIIFPYLVWLNDIKLGGLTFKNTAQHFQKEPQTLKDDLVRIAGFFRQAESRYLDSFTYFSKSIPAGSIEILLDKVRKDLEIFRFLVFSENRSRLSYEHTVPYLVIPDSKNPHAINDEKKVFVYRAYENLGRVEKYLSFYEELGSRKPIFNLNVYSSSDVTSIDIKIFKRLVKKVDNRGLRSLYSYNKIFSNLAVDMTENILRISTALETLLEVNESKGHSIALSELEIDLKNKKIDLTEDQKNIVKKYLLPKVTRQLTDKIFEYTNSKPIVDWFKNSFYPTGSSIRHGDEVDILPRPRESRKRTPASIWYGEGATHDFINNAYFGKKLFRFVFLEKHYPRTKLMRSLEINILEGMLISDEQRLVELEKYVTSTKHGDLAWEKLTVCSSLGDSFFGDKFRIYKLLKRFLTEIQFSYPATWIHLKTDGDLLVNSQLELDNINDHEGFNPYFYGLINLDRKLQEIRHVSDRNDFKLFEIENYVSFALRCLT